MVKLPRRNGRPWSLVFHCVWVAEAYGRTSHRRRKANEAMAHWLDTATRELPWN